MNTRDLIGRTLKVTQLIVEEDVGAENPEDFRLFDPTEKECVIDANSPRLERIDYPLVRWRIAGGDDGDVYSSVVCRVCRDKPFFDILDSVDAAEELGKLAFRKRLLGTPVRML